MTAKAEANAHDSPGAAILAIVAGVGLLTSGDVIAKTVTEGMTPFQYVLIRSCFAFVPVFIALQVSHNWAKLRTKRPWGQAARGLAMATAYNCYLQALQELPIADCTALIFSAPCLVAAMSRFVLGEHVPAQRWVAIGIGFAGVLVIVQPGTEAFRPAGLWGLAGALAAAVTALLARRLGSTEPASVTSFYTTVAFLLTGAIPVALIPGHWDAVAGLDLGLIAIAGCIAGTAHFLIILAYRRGEASLVAPFEYSALVIAIFMGFVFFGDVPSPAVWVGIAMVALAGVLLAPRRGRPRAA